MWGETFDRIQRAVTLDESVYREVAEDARATGPALAVVLGAALAEGIGRLFGEGLIGLLTGLARGCLVWGLWVLGIQATAWALGIASDFAKLFRVLGFAAAPFALGLLEGIPLLGVLISLLKWALVFAAFVTAVRTLHQAELARAAVLCGIGFLIAIVLLIPATWILPS